MKYELITLEEKMVAGIEARTNNTSPDMGMVIGGLWDRFYREGICENIPNKVNNKALGIYTDYAGNEKDDYTVCVAYEVTKGTDMPDGITLRTIPAGNYAKFIVKGDVQKAVGEFWQELWKMDLPRAYQYDFEEYQNDSMEESEIHIYISLKSDK